MWRRQQPVPWTDPTTYCPKSVRNEVVWGYLDDDGRRSKQQWKKIQDFLRQKPPFLCSMLVYAVHQCCGKDRLSLCEKLLDACSDELRTIVCNAPFGKNQYTPLHRCAFNGSERMLRMLCACGADITKASPQNETLLEVLEQGLLHEERSCVYTMADVLHFDAKTRFYTVRMPNQTTHTFSSALVDHRKYVEDGKVYVYTSPVAPDVPEILREYPGGSFWGDVVASLGDVDADGHDDFAVGHWNVGSGAVHIFSGATGALLRILEGSAPDDRFGRALAALGDLNGDGFADFAVAASGNDDGGVDSGKVYVYSGGT